MSLLFESINQKLSRFSQTGFATTASLPPAESRVQEIEGLLQRVSPQGKPSSATTAATAQPGFKNFLTVQEASSATIQPTPQPSQALPEIAAAFGLPTVSSQQSLKDRFKLFQPLIQSLSQKHGVDADLVNAVVLQESGFNPAATSKTGAKGLMQLMPKTAQGLGVTDASDPLQNLDGGIRYLKSLLESQHGNIPLALAAYNAGPGAVNRFGSVPPYAETQQYVRSVLTMYLKRKNQADRALG